MDIDEERDFADQGPLTDMDMEEDAEILSLLLKHTPCASTLLKDLIQRVLHHPDFNADEVDHDMHERLMRAVEEGDIEVIDMWEEGDGLQDNTFVKRKVSMELLADERMVGHQHFGFKLSTDANGDRVFGGDANGILTFELAQIRVGPGTVPISIVLYIDATYIKQGIPIRPIYSE
jgi:hypothetical protein